MFELFLLYFKINELMQSGCEVYFNVPLSKRAHFLSLLLELMLFILITVSCFFHAHPRMRMVLLLLIIKRTIMSTAWDIKFEAGAGRIYSNYVRGIKLIIIIKIIILMKIIINITIIIIHFIGKFLFLLIAIAIL